MASIRHRTLTSGGVSWQVLFRTADGRQTSETFTTDRGAREFKRLVDDLGPTEALEIQRAREGTDASTPTLREWCLTHIDALTGVQDGTRARYRRIVETKLSPLDRLPVDAVTPPAIAKWVNAQARAGLSGKTIANYHGFLSGAMKAAVRARVVESNPCEGTRIPKTERQEMVFLTSDEFAIFLAHVHPRAQDMVALLPATGLRFGEITALQARDVDVEARTLTVARAWKYAEGRGSQPVLGPPKTTRSRRTIALPPQVVSILAARLVDAAPEDYVFTNTAGRPWRRNRFHETVWQPALRAANQRTATPRPLGKTPRVHDMRHTCASWMIRAGLPLPVIQRHLGHESIQTTVDRYGHMEPAHLAMAAGALGQALGAALPEIEGPQAA